MLKVVVMDANAISRGLLSSVLTDGGYEVVGGANTSPASIAAMAKLSPQIVCIDIGTPDEEGFGRIDALRKELPKALLFMVSAKFEAETVQTAAQRGVHGFVVKPFKSATVLTTIRNTIIKVARKHKEQAAEPNS